MKAVSPSRQMLRLPGTWPAPNAVGDRMSTTCIPARSAAASDRSSHRSGGARRAGPVQRLHPPEVRGPVGQLPGLLGDEGLPVHREVRVRRPLVPDRRERQVADPDPADRPGPVGRADDRAVGEREELPVERVVEGRAAFAARFVAHEVDPADGPGEECVAGEDHVRVVAFVQDERQGLGRVPGGLERGEGERAELEPVAVRRPARRTRSRGGRRGGPAPRSGGRARASRPGSPRSGASRRSR